MHRRARMMTVVIAAILSVMALPAHATMLTSAGGQVRVDDGKGFRPVPTVTEVVPGNRIAVGENATAMLHYPNGCTVTIAAGTSITVASKPSCPNPANRPQTGRSGVSNTPSTDPTFVFIGGAAIAGGLIAVTVRQQSHHRASP